MSHYTVLITGDDVEDQLAPFDENTEVEPYKSRIDPKSWWFISSDESVDTTDLVALAEAYNTKYAGEDEEDKVFLDEEGLYSMSTYNPDSKWDWYSIGGRWTGYFLLKLGKRGVSGRPGVMGEANSDPTRCDQALKGDIDIDGMRQEAADKAERMYAEYEVIVSKHGPLPDDSWKELRGKIPDEEFDQRRSDYWEHPTVKALQTSKLIGFMTFPSEMFGVTREEFVENARLEAVPGYAMLHEGEWMEPGKMGWFGMSSDTPDTRNEYLKRVNDIIDSLPDDTLLTVVDCHI